MTPQDFPLLADANIDREVVDALRADGADVLFVREVGLGAAEDDELLELARQQGRVVLTHDRDFGRLAIARRAPFVGIVFVRPGHLAASFTLASIRTLFVAAVEVLPPFLIVVDRRGDAVKIRLRQP